MASEKLAMSETYNDDDERHDDSDETRRPEYQLGKALAHRAIYGSGSGGRRRGRGRNARSTDNKSPPSRLSKVSSADDTQNN